MELASKVAEGERTPSAAKLVERWKERRRFRRQSVMLLSTVETGRGTLQCVTVDLSLGGARIRIDGKLEPLEQVTLVLVKFGRFTGHVVWRNPTEAGLQFDDTPEDVALRFGNDIPFE
jgi:hypothetical protein